MASDHSGWRLFRERDMFNLHNAFGVSFWMNHLVAPKVNHKWIRSSHFVSCFLSSFTCLEKLQKVFRVFATLLYFCFLNKKVIKRKAEYLSFLLLLLLLQNCAIFKWTGHFILDDSYFAINESSISAFIIKHHWTSAPKKTVENLK